MENENPLGEEANEERENVGGEGANMQMGQEESSLDEDNDYEIEVEEDGVDGDVEGDVSDVDKELREPKERVRLEVNHNPYLASSHVQWEVQVFHPSPLQQATTSILRSSQRGVAAPFHASPASVGGRGRGRRVTSQENVTVTPCNMNVTATTSNVIARGNVTLSNLPPSSAPLTRGRGRRRGRGTSMYPVAIPPIKSHPPILLQGLSPT
ncbi:hypothetical protein JCGZ_26683 [Jatropha curcas]|uniref:Uncharacterized protein n=1 Tax=Jatropha curcas TaxID=180498 RepID=A0A067LF60_JATCU|nr:hypothetical protein JCGZ_26683 [Jatropha curcas]